MLLCGAAAFVFSSLASWLFCKQCSLNRQHGLDLIFGVWVIGNVPSAQALEVL